jgi:phosphatidylglycerophosphate synthase
MRFGRYVAIVALFAEVTVLLLLAQLVGPYLGRAEGQTLQVLAIVAVFLAILAKACVSICALFAGSGGHIAVRIMFAGSLLPIGVLNAGLAYRLGQLAVEEDLEVALVVGLWVLAALAALVAVTCIWTGVARLLPRFNRAPERSVAE